MYWRDVRRHLEVAVRARALRVHDALGDALAVEVAELLEQVDVLHEQRARGPAVVEFWSSSTGLPNPVVMCGRRQAWMAPLSSAADTGLIRVYPIP